MILCSHIQHPCFIWQLHCHFLPMLHPTWGWSIEWVMSIQ